jgi:SAM-dependent methyltransferase
VRTEEIHDQVERYYSGRFAEHGATARGVDWNTRESQEVRFAQLLRICSDIESRFSINDYGCGYGALADYLQEANRDVAYTGYDLSHEMLQAAKERLDGNDVRFEESEARLRPADYCVASGIFNVKLEIDDVTWTRYVLATIGRLDQLGRRGFAFNMLTSHSDPGHMRGDLYYGDPAFFFNHCASTISRAVTLLHDYGLYEFTILVRKEAE